MFFQYVSKQLVIAGVAWFAAQFVKCIISMIVNRTVNFNIAFGSGGMPSSHSATVCALAASVGIECGTASPIFGVTCILAFVVMYDAMGVRRETGEQGKLLNDIVDLFEKMGHEVTPERAFKELVGHTPLQVVVGALLGIAVGFGMMALI